jgi:4-amino-4-deoxy-L-arabinose transferase-like glycosyltransferase
VPWTWVRLQARPRTTTFAIGAGLALATVILRLPFAGRHLFDWDSLQFALGMQRFDLAAHRPHPPGYIGYIVAGRLLSSFTGDTNSALVGLSIGAQAVTVAAIFLTARRLLGTFAGVAAAVLLATSPLFWLYGETALTYGLEPGLALLAFCLCLRATEGSLGAIAAAAAVIGLEGAVRPSTAAFMLPVLAYAMIAGTDRGQWARRLLAVAAGIALGCAVWVLPLLWLSGGPAAYLRDTLQLADRVSGGSAVWRAGWWGLAKNVQALLNGVGYSLVLYLPLALAVGLVALAERRGRHHPRSRLAVMLALWVLPASVFFALVHIGQLAYVLFFVPALVLAAGPVLERLAGAVTSRRPRRRSLVRAALLAVLATSNMALYLLPHDSLGTLPASRDRQVAGLVAAVHTWPAAGTVLLADPEGPSSYRVAQYYLPEYATVAVGRDDGGRAGEMFSNRPGAPEYDLARFRTAGPVDLPRGHETVVLDDAVLASLGDAYRLVRWDMRDAHVWSAPMTAADPPTLCLGRIYLRASDCGRSVTVDLLGLRVAYPPGATVGASTR